MCQLKSFASQGDLPKAKMIAQQIALYRNVSDKNFSRSVMIGTQAQLMCSQHRIHQAQIESLKGLAQAHLGQFEDSLASQGRKYAEMASYQEDMDDMCNLFFSKIDQKYLQAWMMSTTILIKRCANPIRWNSRSRQSCVKRWILPDRARYTRIGP